MRRGAYSRKYGTKRYYYGFKRRPQISASYANPRLCLGFAWLSRILLTPPVFISGYANTGKKFSFNCFYKITFPRKKKNSLFRLLIKREILTCREVLYTKLNVISSCFAIKMLSKKGFLMMMMMMNFIHVSMYLADANWGHNINIK